MEKTSIKLLAALLTASLLFGACDPSSEVDYTPSRDCIITAVTMGTLKRTLHTTDSLGQDSTYTVSVTGSLYPIYIDQLDNRIYNADSLPVGTDVSKVTFTTFNVRNSVCIESLTSGADTLFALTDSTDFSQPRRLNVYSEDMQSKRTYTMELRVHREEADTFAWQRVAGGPLTPVAGFVKNRTICVGRSLYVFGQEADGSCQLLFTPTDAPSFASAVHIDTDSGAPLDVRSVQHFGDSFYALAEGRVVTSADGSGTWTDAGCTLRFDALAAASGDSLYALQEGRLYASANGRDWQECLADTPDLLPETDLAAATQPARSVPGMTTTVLVGLRGGEPVVWRHDTDTRGDFSYPWLHLPQTAELASLRCPTLQQYCMATYDDAMLLCGIPADGTEPQLYVSRDYGRTWQSGSLHHPSLAGAQALGMAVDADHYLWVVCGGSGEVLKGRINRLGWDQEPTEFESMHR